MAQALSIETHGDLGVNIKSFERHLKAANLSPKTQEVYLESAVQFARFRQAQGMPQDIAKLTREHVESYIVHMIETRSPATANVRYRALQAF